MHVLEDFTVLVSPVADETPHEAVGVKRGPAYCKNHHQNDWKKSKREKETMWDG